MDLTEYQKYLTDSKHVPEAIKACLLELKKVDTALNCRKALTSIVASDDDVFKGSSTGGLESYRDYYFHIGLSKAAVAGLRTANRLGILAAPLLLDSTQIQDGTLVSVTRIPGTTKARPRSLGVTERYDKNIRWDVLVDDLKRILDSGFIYRPVSEFEASLSIHPETQHVLARDWDCLGRIQGEDDEELMQELITVYRELPDLF